MYVQLFKKGKPVQTPRHLLLIALLLPAIGHAQTSQTYYFGEGQSSLQSRHFNKPTRKQPQPPPYRQTIAAPESKYAFVIPAPLRRCSGPPGFLGRSRPERIIHRHRGAFVTRHRELIDDKLVVRVASARNRLGVAEGRSGYQQNDDTAASATPAPKANCVRSILLIV
jgi:hypothetical protein